MIKLFESNKIKPIQTMELNRMELNWFGSVWSYYSFYYLIRFWAGTELNGINARPYEQSSFYPEFGELKSVISLSYWCCWNTPLFPYEIET